MKFTNLVPVRSIEQDEDALYAAFIKVEGQAILNDVPAFTACGTHAHGILNAMREDLSEAGALVDTQIELFKFAMPFSQEHGEEIVIGFEVQVDTKAHHAVRTRMSQNAFKAFIMDYCGCRHDVAAAYIGYLINTFEESTEPSLYSPLDTFEVDHLPPSLTHDFISARVRVTNYKASQLLTVG
ncbi:MAG: hypothetical protein LPH21_09705 [Shewanella sp.]|nr:hypothetical protein [Shewanella sp.]